MKAAAVLAGLIVATMMAGGSSAAPYQSPNIGTVPQAGAWAVTAAASASSSPRRRSHRAHEGRVIERYARCDPATLDPDREFDEMCEFAWDLCSEQAPVLVLQFDHVGEGFRPEDREFTGVRCVGEGEGEGAPAFSIADFRRLPLPPGKLNIQPADGQVLINYPMNVYVDARPVTLRTQVLGVGVEVEATPASYRWEFGDGGRLTTADPGGAYPDMTTSHTYRHPGSQRVSLMTSYTGRFRVEGSRAWIPVEGVATVASPSVTVEVIEARAVLVP